MEECPNLSYVQTLAAGDTDFEQRFIQIIKEEFPDEATLYLSHIRHDEPRAAAEIVHKLKHKFNILSMEKAYAFAVEYEEQLQIGDMKHDLDFRKILDTITRYLKTI
ncbi:Hpt domain-containing protein [Flavobacteriaceae bacterium TP-CH-4]|uniref:Hpt domain-containing protein n=1 Tax=Pelagihabitans pacificus TaxID=2696054 RepID=A0A967ARC0_9FLAO|nr:Hpt domain-containing protein [Pelagihabitans pacificus]NHF58567.1 Hpt domain-containing protein [Pelagihabitans pacificus]